MKILLWDIDGTLMKTDRAGLYAFQEAISDILHTDICFESIKTAGMTDCYIAEQIISLVKGREATANEIAELIKRYQEVLPSHLAERKGTLMPNILEILEHFHNRSDVISLLLTGNTAFGAEAKVKRYGIAHYFNFAASAFGDKCADRNQLAANALTNITEYYTNLTSPRLFVIGDTPNDVRCGKHINANTIAVATGGYSLEDLIEHSPWWAVKSLPSPQIFEAKLMTI